MRKIINLAICIALAIIPINPGTANAQGGFSCLNVTEIPQIECEGLVALFNVTNGNDWTENTNWLITNSPGNWIGIQISLGHVQSIDLSNNHLSGSIPPQLGSLSNLTHLYLHFNGLTGSIPPELANLNNLQYLRLDNNQLTGFIPPQLGSLSNLKNLGLSGNQLSGSIPPQLGSLSNLTDLYLPFNGLTGSIPPELANLSNLQSLGLHFNGLTGSIPPELANLSNLQSLRLDFNQLTGSIPPQLGSLSNLLELGLITNQLTGSIPPELGSLSNLTYLYLESNQLTGSIPPELGSLSYLSSLLLSNNQLSGSIPLSFLNLTNLDTFTFFDNSLCEPPDPAFLAWKSTVLYWTGTGITCNGSLYGRVTNIDNEGLAGVQIKNGSTVIATTDESGYYSAALQAGKYTISPFQTTRFFTPPSRSIQFSNDTELNFTGYPCIAPSGLNVCLLQPGDILVERSPAYAAVFSIGGTYFTHAAMYLGMTSAPGQGEETVAPRLAEAQGVHPEESLHVWETDLTSHTFWTGEDLLDWAAVRPKTSPNNKNGAITYIRNKAAEAGVVFDILATRSSIKEFYCSKLVWRSYLDTPDGIDLETNVGLGSLLLDYWVTPDDLFFSFMKDSDLIDWKLGVNNNLYKLMIWSPAHIILEDPEGRRTGYDAASGTILNEIPLADYTAEPQAEVETITAVGVGDGWRVIVTGYDNGSYRLDQSYLIPGSVNIVTDGTTTVGQVDEYAIEDPVFGIFLPLVIR